MKREEGIVIELKEENIARVKAGRHNECKNCGACPGDNAMVLEAVNKANAKIGDKVAYEIYEHNMVVSTFMVFIMPIFMIFLGVFVSSKFNVPVAVGVIVALAISGIVIKLFDKKVKSGAHSIPVIVEKL